MQLILNIEEFLQQSSLITFPYFINFHQGCIQFFVKYKDFLFMLRTDVIQLDFDLFIPDLVVIILFLLLDLFHCFLYTFRFSIATRILWWRWLAWLTSSASKARFQFSWGWVAQLKVWTWEWYELQDSPSFPGAKLHGLPGDLSSAIQPPPITAIIFRPRPEWTLQIQACSTPLSRLLLFHACQPTTL